MSLQSSSPYKGSNHYIVSKQSKHYKGDPQIYFLHLKAYILNQLRHKYGSNSCNIIYDPSYYYPCNACSVCLVFCDGQSNSCVNMILVTLQAVSVWRGVHKENAVVGSGRQTGQALGRRSRPRPTGKQVLPAAPPQRHPLRLDQCECTIFLPHKRAPAFRCCGASFWRYLRFWTFSYLIYMGIWYIKHEPLVYTWVIVKIYCAMV